MARCHFNFVSIPFALSILLITGCKPPTNVFFPVAETRFESTPATVQLQGLTSATAVCYTIDGSQPLWDNGTCAGATTEKLIGPIESADIELSCLNDTSSETIRTVKIAFDWPNTGVVNMAANYFLNCQGNTNQPEPVKIAFIGDTGAGSNFQSVLNLIRQEQADLTVIAGDTSYDRNKDDDWDAMVRNTLGSSDPALIAAGNHDYGDSTFDDVRQYGINRLNQASDIDCEGQYAEQMSCQIGHVYLVLSAIGSNGSRSDHENYISSRLNNAPEDAWRVCAWHKNQRDMQVGGKSDEVGWTAYETCRNRGAIIATGHEHSYSRTHLLRDMSDKSVASTSNEFTVENGRTFAFVSGLGGIGIRDQERSGNWWASIYTSTQGARYGAMFGTFYADYADFYFKNIRGDIIDQFRVYKGY